ncbi:MAG: acyltransferase family protein [Myxococcota bacterium]|nr:acyltransferase family protein [Myxococcota bacterium]
MAKGVLGNDPFRRGAASRTPEEKQPAAAVKEKAVPEARPAKRRSTAKGRADASLVAAPAETEIKQPSRKKQARGNRAGARNAEALVVQPPVPDDTRDVTRAIQDATPELPQEPEVPEPEDAGEDLPPSVRHGLRARGAGAERLAGAEHRRLLEKPAAADSTDSAALLSDDDRSPEFSEEDSTEGERSDDDAERLSAQSAVGDSAQEAPADDAENLSAEGSGGKQAGARPQASLHSVAGALALARELAAQTFRTDRVGQAARVADALFSALMTGIGASGSDQVDAYGKDANLAKKLSPISNFFYERYWRVTVEGAPHVPKGPSLLVANHSGAIPIDGFILHQALQRERPDLQEARWLAEDQIFHAPFLGTLYNRLGAIRASPENAVRLLDEGRPVITFPEGVHGIRKPFQERYQLKRLGRGGFAKLAIRQQVPIIPVAIVGAEESMPLLGKLPGGFLGLPYLPLTVPPLPARWMIRFGEPIRMEGVPASAAEDLLEVQKLVERTRESIEGMLRALLKERGTVFGG